MLISARNVLRSTSCHALAFFGTLSASFRATLAVVVVVLPTLIGTPFANLGTQLADLTGVLAISRHRLHAGFADVDALSTAAWAVVVTLLSTHGFEAFGASDHTLLTRFDTTFELDHRLLP
ncbi:hypothetical protein [Novipirellula rosea]|uniref:hypothetical protein n=1 Tax=Novipirellula rosea TaxID=1031540 RepID=UPI0031E64DB2